MKHFFALLFLAVTSAGLCAQSEIRSFSLTEAISYAEQNQPAFQNYRIDKQIASAKRLESTSKYLPKLNGSFDLRDNLKLAQIVLKFPNPITNVEEERTIQQGTKYYATTGVDLLQPILDMNAVADMEYSKKQTYLAELQYQQALIDLKISVSRSYYLVLLNTERVSKAEKSVERFQKAYDDTRVRYDNDNAVKTDLNRAYLNLSNAQFQLKVAQDSVTTSKSAFGQLLGMPSGESFTLSDALPVNVNPAAMPEYPDLEAVASGRVEMKAEIQQQILNKVQLKRINLQYVPTLNGYGYVGAQGLDNSSITNSKSWYWNSYIGLRLTIPIFDGLQKASMANQQKLVIRKNENNLLSIRNNISYQLKATAISYANAGENLKIIEQNVKLAEEIVADVNLRYKNELATYQEVLDAESTLKDTEFNYLQALYVYLLAELEWKKANAQL